MTVQANAPSAPARAAILASQQAWARGRQLSADQQGYLANVEDNFFQPLSPVARKAFEEGSGCELRDRDGRPAKMRALHSSSALAVNVFDFWTSRGLGPVLRALEIEGDATDFAFERKLPTGKGGTPPNVDVVIPLADRRLVGIESKYTEWLTPKPAMAKSLTPYCDEGESSWSGAGLGGCHGLVSGMKSGSATFSWLDVPQLLKHALGLRRAAASGWFLRYLYFDAPGREGDEHRAEIARFEAAVDEELRFKALSYQAFIARLEPLADAEAARYVSYLRSRYFGG